MEDTGVVVAFYLLSAVTIGSALMVAISRNLIHAVVYLIVSFVGVAGLYVTLSADFVAVSQILIYAGAVSVLILFAIMLTPLAGKASTETFMRWPALLIALLVAGTLGYAALETGWSISDRTGFDETASVIGELLLNRYLLAFEIAAVLMLAAVLGAIMLVRPEGTAEEEPED